MLKTIIIIGVTIVVALSSMFIADECFAKDRSGRIKALLKRIDEVAVVIFKAEEFLEKQKTLKSNLEGAVSELRRVESIDKANAKAEAEKKEKKAKKKNAKKK